MFQTRRWIRPIGLRERIDRGASHGFCPFRDVPRAPLASGWRVLARHFSLGILAVVIEMAWLLG
jgi:hypothetical protein